jgi:hypothetical protein
LLLAIVENAPDLADTVTRGAPGSVLGIVLALGGRLVVSGVALVAGTVWLGPVHLVSRIAARDGQA